MMFTDSLVSPTNAAASYYGHNLVAVDLFKLKPVYSIKSVESYIQFYKHWTRASLTKWLDEVSSVVCFAPHPFMCIFTSWYTQQYTIQICLWCKYHPAYFTALYLWGVFVHHSVSCYQAEWIESAEFALHRVNLPFSLWNLFPHVVLLCVRLLVVNNRLTSGNVANIWDSACFLSLIVTFCAPWLHLAPPCF